METALTTIQAKVLAAIRDRLDRGESAPTYRDLCAQFGWSSTGTARDHLRALERKGHLELPGGRGHRQIRLTEAAPATTRVPLVGQVVAGVPLLAEENVEGRVPVPSEWLDRRPHFAVHVAGDSMVNAGILDGDCVIVRQQATAENGEIVVTTLDGETTLKRLLRRGRRVALIAENPLYAPIEIRTEDAVIQGVVVGLLRAYGGRDSGWKRTPGARRNARHDC
jgi:repressor LexA